MSGAIVSFPNIKESLGSSTAAFLSQGDGSLVFLLGLLGEKFHAPYAIHPLLPFLKDPSELTQPSHPFDVIVGGMCAVGIPGGGPVYHLVSSGRSKGHRQ